MKQRDSVEIRVWMLRNKLRIIHICQDLGFNDKTVSATIDGRENNRKVLAWLVDKGCPRKFLALPKATRTTA